MSIISWYSTTNILAKNPFFFIILGTRSRPRQEEDVDLVTVYTDVYNMRIELEKMKKPIGTRDSPARSCKDLLFGHPQLKDGYYWIDPNLGMNDDAVKVYCSMSTGRSNTRS